MNRDLVTPGWHSPHGAAGSMQRPTAGVIVKPGTNMEAKREMNQRATRTMNPTMIFQADISDEFIERIAERVIDKLRPLLPTAPRTDDDTIFDVKGLADYLKTTEAWVRDQARNGSIPCFKSGKYWKFHKRQIDRVYQSRTLLPVSAATGKGRA